jgi:hypothetical protein
MGFLGILEDRKLQHVPATVILSEEQHLTSETTVGLKRGTGSDADIILIPQPCVISNQVCTIMTDHLTDPKIRTIH